MVKHGASHGLSILICTIISSVLIELLKPVWPKVFNKIETYSEQIIQIANIPLNKEIFAVIIFASLLGIIWGFFFKLRFT